MFQFDSFTDRQPFGAVRKATTIHFTAKADGAVTQASLIIMPDGRGDQTETLPMTKSPNGYTVSFAILNCKPMKAANALVRLMAVLAGSGKFIRKMPM